MLAPDDIEPILNLLDTFYVQVCTAEQLDTIVNSLQIYPVKKEAQWIIDLRHHMEILRKGIDGWSNVKMAGVSQTLSPFLQYYNKFRSVSSFLPQADSGEMAATLVDRLLSEAEQNMESARLARVQFDDWTKSALCNVAPLQESIQQAWHDLGASEQKIVTLSNQIVQVQNDIAGLDGVLGMDKIVSGGQNVCIGVAKMTYGVMMGGSEIPYMTVAKVFFTLGKLFYDVFSTAKKLHQKMESLHTYSLDLTFEQQALAQTKSMLMFVYDLKSLLERQQTMLPQVEEFWRQEARNLRTVRNTFALAEDFSPQHPEILQLPIAQSVWFSLKDTAGGFVDRFHSPVDHSTRIAITT